MTDRREMLREEAARCLEAARQSKTPEARAGLTQLAARLLELASQTRIDFDALVAEYNTQQMMPPSLSVASCNNSRLSLRTTTRKNRPAQLAASRASLPRKSPAVGAGREEHLREFRNFFLAGDSAARSLPVQRHGNLAQLSPLPGHSSFALAL
jgi:hypothetical protein